MEVVMTMDNGLDFVVILGESPPEGYPGDILTTEEANAALRLAYIYASEAKSVYQQTAKVYIEALVMNRDYEANTLSGRNQADKTQILYILANLTYWRGSEARLAKKVLNEYIEAIKR